MKIISRNLDDTAKVGEIIGRCLKPGTVICLEGDLGAGKTTLTQSIARALDIENYVTSPTFTIIKEYQGRLKLNHMDAYRLESDDEMYDLGYDEYIYSDGVCIIEWASRIQDLIPKDAITITINIDYCTEQREMNITGEGDKFKSIEEGLKEYENIRN